MIISRLTYRDLDLENVYCKNCGKRNPNIIKLPLECKQYIWEKGKYQGLGICGGFFICEECGAYLSFTIGEVERLVAQKKEIKQ